jgi:SWIM/SEC-C metal-binding protein
MHLTSTFGLLMSDKFFFKGRQDARQNHIKYGYKDNFVPNSGIKSPMQLVVTSEARKLEVEALVAQQKLLAEVRVDDTEGAEESIAELMAFINKGKSVTVDKVPARNEPCLCGSGKKFKKCCG